MVIGIGDDDDDEHIFNKKDGYKYKDEQIPQQKRDRLQSDGVKSLIELIADKIYGVVVE